MSARIFLVARLSPSQESPMIMGDNQRAFQGFEEE
jgi:hypothetical protein